MNRFITFEGLSLLLVEDDPFVREYLCSFFQSAGCKVSAFDSAEKALESLKKHSCDAIICDYQLPGINGLEFFKKVRRSHPSVIRILITGCGGVETYTSAWKAGIHEYIEKPFMAEALEGALHLVSKMDG